MEPSVTDVPMYPKSGTTVSALSASSKGESSTPSSLAGDQGLRTSAIPLPEGNIGNVRNSRTDVDARIHKPRDSKSEDVDGNHATAGLRVDDKQPPNPDLVLLFNTPSADASQEEWTTAQAELARLVKNLHGAGLLTSLASGPDGAQQRILFIKAVQSAVRAEAQKERFSDWLRTLRTGACREDLGSPRDFQNEPLAPAERLRLVSKMLEDILYSNPQDVESLQTHKPFTHAAAYFPLHDDRFNERWLKQWSKAQLFIPDEQLSDIRDHFGDGIALYFELLRFYFRALAFPAFTGLCTWFGGHYFSKLYSIGLVIWSVVFVESWSIRERQLAVRWGTLGISQDNIDLRPGFKPEQIITSPITGRKVPHSPWWKREGRMLAGLPALVAFALALATMICCIFSAEVIIGEVYNGPGKQYISLLPLVGYAGIVPQVVGLWHKVAIQLTDWENHPTRFGHERALTLKLFALNAIVSYGVLTLTAYVYLPFSSFVVPFLVQKLRGNVDTASAYGKSLDHGTAFAVNSHRLTNTLFALMTTTQAIGAFTEVVLPYLQSKISQEYHKQTEKQDNNPDSSWISQVREQCSRHPMELFSEYVEMVIQFGHVVLFSTAWPLAPVAALINNFFELRGDAFKLCKTLRRPVPTRADSIGPWLNALTFLCYLGALTNASLVYLLRPYTPETPSHSVGNTVQEMLQAVGNATKIRTLPPGSQSMPYTTARVFDAQGNYHLVLQTMLSALLCALASEHGFMLLRLVTKHLFERMLWQGSKEEAYVRGLNWQLRRDYITSREGEAYEKEINRLIGRRQRDLDDIQTGSNANMQMPSAEFWQEQNVALSKSKDQ